MLELRSRNEITTVFLILTMLHNYLLRRRSKIFCKIQSMPRNSQAHIISNCLVPSSCVSQQQLKQTGNKTVKLGHSIEMSKGRLGTVTRFCPNLGGCTCTAKEFAGISHSSGGQALPAHSHIRTTKAEQCPQIVPIVRHAEPPHQFVLYPTSIPPFDSSGFAGPNRWMRPVRRV